MSNPIQDEPPWYRQFWPWFVAFPPAATVVGGFVTLWLAGTGPALVVDDYGQIGKVTAQRAVRDERAAELGLSARVGLDDAADDGVSVVTVNLSQSDSRTELPEVLVVRIVHPTRAELDAEAVVSGSRGYYAGQIMRPGGRLYIHVGDAGQTWRLVGELAPAATRVELRAKDRARTP